jgi:O-antigen ligase
MNMMNKVLKAIIYTGLAIIPFVPLFVFSSTFFPFITGKAFIFRIVVEIIFAAWLVLTLSDINFRPKRNILLYTFSAFLVVIFFANFFGMNFTRSFWSNFERMEGYITLLHLFGYFLIMGTVLKSEIHWRRYFNITLIANAILCVFFALKQVVGAAQIHQSATRVDGTLGNATYLAIYLMMHIFIALILFFRTKNMYTRIAYGVSILLQLFIMYHTGTRGAVLGLIMGLGLCALLIALFERKEKMLRKVSIGAIVFLLLLVGGFMLVKDKSFVRNSPTLSRFAEISFQSSFFEGQGRYYVWPIAWQGIKERPVLGYGQNNFSYVFNKNYDPHMWAQEQWFDRTHNIVLDWLIAGGFLGLLSYLSIFVAAFWLIWRRRIINSQ